MEKDIFVIENLKCAYSKNDSLEKRVLDIEYLHIPKGKMVFFVGPSGIGKSTILEILGFMNDTIVSVDKFHYKGQDVSKAWQEWNDDQISDFRNKQFSFIFQDNNLMPNFTAYENVMITAMFQGKDRTTSMKETQDILQLLDVPYLEDRSIHHYSGGQRQRLAFARAILPDFEVLFGDEPTGNLDKGSAENVTRILQNKVHERNVTAIIVSHDMRLAEKYADMIVQIQRKERNIDGTIDYYGCINENGIFYKDANGWYDAGYNRFSDAEFLKILEGAL